jgi:hypothetical protein
VCALHDRALGNGLTMLLSTELRQRIQADTGCYVTEACDRCGQLLGAVRFTRKGDSGVWCSRSCRNGVKAITPGLCRCCGVSLTGRCKRALSCSDTCRKRHQVQDRTNNPETHIQNKVLTDGEIGRGYLPTRRPEIEIIPEGIAS